MAEQRLPSRDEPSAKLTRRLWSVRAAVISLALLVCAGVVVLQAWELSRSRDAALTDARSITRNLAHSFAEHASISFGGVDAVLSVIVDRLEQDKAPTTFEVDWGNEFKEFGGSIRQLRQWTIINADGERVASSNRAELRAHNNSDREYFAYHRDHPDRSTHIGLPIKSRSRDGSWTLIMSRRLNYPDGTFAGVVLGAIELDYFQQVYERINLGRVGSVVLMRDDGRILVRFPFDETNVGRDFSQLDFFRSYPPSALFGDFQTMSPVDGEKKLAAFARVGRFPLIAIVAVGEEESLANWRSGLESQLIGSFIFFVLVITLGAVSFFQIALQNELKLLADKSAQQYKLLADFTKDVVIAIDRNNRRSYVSPNIKQVLGYDPEPLLGESPTSLIYEQDRETVTQLIEELESGLIETGVATYRVKRADGSLIWVEAAAQRVTDAETGEYAGVVASLRDISARVEQQAALGKLAASLSVARQEAEDAARAKSAFLANMSHEIRTPLGGVIGLADLALRSNSAAVQSDYLEKIDRSARKLLGIVNEILDFSKIESGRIDLERTAFSVPALMNDLEDLFAAQAAKKAIGLKIMVASQTPEVVVGDALKVSQILNNIVGNAIKFTEVGEVAVHAQATAAEGHAVMLEFIVKDTGIGIDPAVLPQLFNAFSQADSSTTRKFGGTGLGLVISKRLAEAMGGSVRCESKPGEGTCFFISLCVETAAPEVALEPPDRRRRGDEAGFQAALAVLRGVSVLVVEDDEINRQIVGELLRAVGVSVTVARNGESALAALERASFHAILMDVQMPGMDGYETTRRARAAPGVDRVPIIALTAHVGEEERRRCEAAGMNAHLTKPIEPRRLYQVLAAWIRVPDGGRNGAKDSQRLRAVVDIAEVKQRLAGNSDMLRRLFAQFRVNYQDFPDQISDRIANGSRVAALDLIHRAKGVTGNLAANQAFIRLQTLETMLQEEETPSEQIEQAMVEFAAVWRDLMAAAESIVAIVAEGETPRASTDLVDIEQSLTALLHLLDASDLEAVPRFAELRTALEGLGFAQAAREIAAALDALDFSAASRLIEDLVRTIAGSRS